MIQSTDELQTTHEQLGRAIKALASLRATVLPKNERNYHIMAEAYIDEIRKLREDIDAYLDLPPYEMRTELRGTIRAVNLDENSFTLARRQHGPDLECSYADDLARDVRQHIDHEVVLHGVLLTNRRNGRQSMDVESIAVAAINLERKERKAG